MEDKLFWWAGSRGEVKMTETVQVEVMKVLVVTAMEAVDMSVLDSSMSP